MTTVGQAWSAVMEDVQGIHKGSRNQQQGFAFRGVDQVLGAVGPALRKHGVIIVSSSLSMEVERYETAKGGQMQGVIVLQEYTVYGPEGDSFTGRMYGQAADAGDKAVSKAESVAYRQWLLHSLTVPLGDEDPDAQSHERGASQQWQHRDTPRASPNKGISDNQLKLIGLLMKKVGLTDRQAAHDFTTRVIGREIESAKDLSSFEASKVIDALKQAEDTNTDAATGEVGGGDPWGQQ